MANTVITEVGSTTATGQITGLQSAFNSSNYYECGIATTECSYGQSYQPGGTVGTVTAPSSGSNTYTNTFLLENLWPGEEDTLYGWAKADDGLYYSAGSDDITTEPTIPTSVTVTSVDTDQIGITWTNQGTRDTIQVKLDDGTWEDMSSQMTLKVWFNLTPDTFYDMHIRYVSNGLTGATVTKTGTTLPVGGVPSTPTNLAIDDYIDKGWTLSWDYSGSPVSYYSLYATGDNASDDSFLTVNNPDDWDSGLAYGGIYDVKIKAVNAAGVSAWSSEQEMVVAPARPDTLTLDSVSDVSITVDIDESPLGYYDNIVVYLKDSSYNIVQTLTKATDGLFTFTNLDPGTLYYVTAKAEIEGIYSLSELSISATTSAPSRPNDWSWTTSIVSGNALGTFYESNGQYYQEIVTATEWNNFTDRINDFRTYLGLSEATFVTVSYHGNSTASVLSQVITAIDDMNPPTSCPSALTVGANVTAATLNGLKNSLNSIA